MSDVQSAAIKEDGFFNSEGSNYLKELRMRSLRVVGLWLLWFCILYPYSNQLYVHFAKPLAKILPDDWHFIAIGVSSSFVIPLKLTLWCALFLTVPFLLQQLWSFIAPALYVNERKSVWIYLTFSIFLFYGGMAFAYFFVLPLLFTFLVHMTPPAVKVLPDIKLYTDLTLQFFMLFGVIFELPLAVVFIVQTGITTVSRLVESRPYFIVCAFIVAMFLSPPDVFSQILLAIPICGLFEVGIVITRILQIWKRA